MLAQSPAGGTSSPDQLPEVHRAHRANDKPPKLGFNVIGYVSSNVGMGVAARHYIRLLLDQGHAVAVLDVDVNYPQDVRNRDYADLTVAHARDLPHAINLIMLNISDLPELFLQPPEGLFREGRINAGLIWWELTVLPDRWIEAIRLFDVVLAGSDFVRHVMEFNVPGVRAVPAKHPVYLPAEGVTGDRLRFGLPEDRVLFLSSFDPLSGVQRKNPLGAVVAFQRAFPDKHDDRANLVIKLNNVNNSSIVRARTLVESLRAQCESDSRLRVIAETLTYADVLQLYASCDVFVSLHRSEGLGLGPLETMRLGRPVIATAWSGNMTYMNYGNACLVSHRFIPAGGDDHYTPAFLGKAGYWADPDLTEAAHWMKVLVDSPEIRARLCKRAFESTAIYQEDAERASFVDEILAIRNQREITSVGSRRYQDVAALREAHDAHGTALREAELAHRSSLQTPREKFLKKARTTLERHVLWRFK